MKNTLVATLLLASCGYLSYAQNNVTVKGQIKGVESGRLYMLAPVSENRVDTLGTALFQAPDFVLEGRCDEPVVAHIVVENYSGGFPFMQSRAVRTLLCLPMGGRPTSEAVSCRMLGRDT